jgi:EAL and modified HD-GYP domain-containing signal transduction protein
MDHFLGRRPIFTAEGDVYAYDLIVESLTPEGAVRHGNRDVASAKMMVKSFLDNEVIIAAGGLPVVVPISRVFVESPELICWRPDSAYLSINESVVTDPALSSGVKRLLDVGYRLVIDDCEMTSGSCEVCNQASVVAIDTTVHPKPVIAAIVNHYERSGLKLLAKGVKNRQQLASLRDRGFGLFQGYFWKEHEAINGDCGAGNRLAVLRLLVELSDPDCSIEKIEHLVAMDPSLTLRLLRFINSPISGLAREVESIRHAIVLVGLETIRSWVMLLAIADLGTARPQAVQAAFVRAKFCQSLAEELGVSGGDSYFTGGLFSLMDSVLGLPMEQILAGTPLVESLKAGILSRAGEIGEAIDLAAALEEGLLPGSSDDVPVPLPRLASLYIEALSWAVNVTSIL